MVSTVLTPNTAVLALIQTKPLSFSKFEHISLIRRAQQLVLKMFQIGKVKAKVSGFKNLNYFLLS